MLEKLWYGSQGLRSRYTLAEQQKFRCNFFVPFKPRSSSLFEVIKCASIMTVDYSWQRSIMLGGDGVGFEPKS